MLADAYGRTLAYVYLDADKDGSYKLLFNEDLLELGLARIARGGRGVARRIMGCPLGNPPIWIIALLKS
jgi:hypothetical protein